MTGSGFIKTLAPVQGSRNKFASYQGVIPASQLRHPEKYMGDVDKIIYRSNWEKRFIKYCDVTENVIKWGSEPFGIEYTHPLDDYKKVHMYYIDFILEVREDDGSVIKYLVEIKPWRKLLKPEIPHNMDESKMKKVNENIKAYVMNSYKFAYAKRFAEEHGYRFIVLTEHDIFKSHKII
jgi:hypothetical protein